MSPAIQLCRFAVATVFAVTGRVDHDADPASFSEDGSDFGVHGLLLHLFDRMSKNHQCRCRRRIPVSLDQSESNVARSPADVNFAGLLREARYGGYKLQHVRKNPNPILNIQEQVG